MVVKRVHIEFMDGSQLNECNVRVDMSGTYNYMHIRSNNQTKYLPYNNIKVVVIEE